MEFEIKQIVALVLIVVAIVGFLKVSGKPDLKLSLFYLAASVVALGLATVLGHGATLTEILMLKKWNNLNLAVIMFGYIFAVCGLFGLANAVILKVRGGANA